MNKTIDTETLLLKVESHEHRIGIMENLLRDAKQVLLVLKVQSPKAERNLCPKNGDYKSEINWLLS